MRSKQVQILSGICGVQLIGYACRAAGFKTDIWIGFAGSVFLMLDIVYLAIQEKGRKKCPECDSEISKKVGICPECGYLFQQGLSEEQLTGYIEQEQEKEMSSEQIDRAFEKAAHRPRLPRAMRTVPLRGTQAAARGAAMVSQNRHRRGDRGL